MKSFEIKNGINPVIGFDIEAPWYSKKKNEEPLKCEINLSEQKSGEENGISYNVYRYESKDNFINGVRICVNANGSAYFIADFIESVEEVCIFSEFFAINSHGKATCNIADKNRLVIRSCGNGAKHFRLMSTLDNADITDKAGLMMPCAITSELDFVYSMYEGLYSFGKKHISLYGFCCDDESNIGKWHFKHEGEAFIAEPPAGHGGICAELTGDGLKVCDSENPLSVAVIK